MLVYLDNLLFRGAVGETRTPWGITRSPLTTTLFPRVDCNEHNINTVRFFIGFLAVLFLIGQLLVWQDLVQAGYYVSGSPANGYFYVFTTLHGFHLLGGLVYWMMTINKVWKLDTIIIRNAKHTIELCAIYWHFLLAVWIVLFGLMLFS